MVQKIVGFRCSLLNIAKYPLIVVFFAFETPEIWVANPICFALRNTAELPHIRLEAGKPSLIW